jgi:hypothetical protein
MKAKVLIGFATLFVVMMFAGHVGATEMVFEGSIIQESYNRDVVNECIINVDYWNFTVNTTGTVTIDVLSWERDPDEWFWVDVNGDGKESFIDSYIHVFKDSLAAENIYASNDDGGTNGRGDGTIRGNDSYLSREFEAGDYIIAISSCGYPASGSYPGYFTVDEAVDGYNQRAIIPYSEGEGDHGDYRITLTGDVSAAPLPAAAWLLGSGLAGLAALRRKKAMIGEP